MNRLSHAGNDRMEFFVLPDQRLVLIDQLSDLREQCGWQCAAARHGRLTSAPAASLCGARGHQFTPSLTDSRAPDANSLPSLVNSLAPTDLERQQQLDQ